MLTVRKKLIYYGQNTTLHGLKYVADRKRHPFIRLIWISIFVLNFLGMLLVLQESYKSYTENAISFVTETAYLNWNTTFPAITLCEIAGTPITWDEDVGDAEETADIESFVADLVFFTGSCYSCSSPCSACEKLNFTGVVEKFRKKCPQLLRKCSWNNMEFDCCHHFLPMQTEYGVCFSINSLHTAKSNFQLVSNRQTGPGELMIESIEDVRLFIHAPEDVPFINSDPDLRKDIMLGETYNISLNVIEIENDENVKSLPVEKRACRFPWEKPPNLIVHDYYSYSTCVVQCHADNHVELCNCTHHFMPVFNTVNRLHAKGFDKSGLVCDCLPSCVEPEYKVVADTKGATRSYSEIYVKMQSLPTSRFKRIVIRTTLDLVVCIGGTAGLFIGASILSIVDTLYLLFIRNT